MTPSTPSLLGGSGRIPFTPGALVPQCPQSVQRPNSDLLRAPRFHGRETGHLQSSWADCPRVGRLGPASRLLPGPLGRPRRAGAGAGQRGVPVPAEGRHPSRGPQAAPAQIVPLRPAVGRRQCFWLAPAPGSQKAGPKPTAWQIRSQRPDRGPQSRAKGIGLV